MKYLFVAALTALVLPLKSQAAPLNSAQIAPRGLTPQAIVPRGWQIEKRLDGDLNRDKIADAALVLVQQKPAKFAAREFENRARALLVLFKTSSGWRRAGFNNSLLLGTRDGGAFYGSVETPVNLSIKSGVLVVNQDSGSREITETTHKFRLDKRTQRFYLIESEQINRDRATGKVERTQTDFLSGIQKTTLMKAESERVTTKTTRVSQKLRSLESVKGTER